MGNNSADAIQFTRHAQCSMKEREISEEWVERVISEPDLRTKDPNDAEVEHFYKPLTEEDG